MENIIKILSPIARIIKFINIFGIIILIIFSILDLGLVITGVGIIAIFLSYFIISLLFLLALPFIGIWQETAMLIIVVSYCLLTLLIIPNQVLIHGGSTLLIGLSWSYFVAVPPLMEFIIGDKNIFSSFVAIFIQLAYLISVVSILLFDIHFPVLVILVSLITSIGFVLRIIFNRANYEVPTPMWKN
jgi:hypothetical protein